MYTPTCPSLAVWVTVGVMDQLPVIVSFSVLPSEVLLVLWLTKLSSLYPPKTKQPQLLTPKQMETCWIMNRTDPRATFWCPGFILVAGPPPGPLVLLLRMDKSPQNVCCAVLHRPPCYSPACWYRGRRIAQTSSKAFLNPALNLLD